MNMSKTDKSTFSHFFKEDAVAVQDVIGAKDQKDNLNVNSVKPNELPRFIKGTQVSEDEFKSSWKDLRSFFRNGNKKKSISKELSPVLLSPLLNAQQIAGDYPLWIAAEDASISESNCFSLRELLLKTLGEIGPEEKDAHILKENVERIVQFANNQFGNENKPKYFLDVINESLKELENQLEVTGDEAPAFAKSLADLKKTLPQYGVLLPYSSGASLQILDAAMISSLEPNRNVLLEEVKNLTCRLKDLLRVEREKKPQEADQEKIKGSMDFAESMVNFDDIAAILPESGSEIMDGDRIERIRKTADILENKTDILTQKGYVFVDETLHSRKEFDWKNLFEKRTVETYKSGEGCEKIQKMFNSIMAEWTQLVVALRTGNLEFEGNYQPDVHDEFFANFDWENFSDEELQFCPQFLLIADDNKLFENELNKLSTLLTLNIPVKVAAIKSENQVDFSNNGAQINDQLHSNVDLNTFVLSNKNIFISQSTAITPLTLFDGFTSGLSAFSPAFFHLFHVDNNGHEQPFLYTSATIESRDFPGFTYTGTLGTPWGSRFEIHNNPQADKTWPIHSISAIDENGEEKEVEMAFTFADLLASEKTYGHLFCEVNPSLWSEDLMPISEFLSSSNEDNIGKVPFIWMLDKTNSLQKVAVSYPIVIACMERTDYWQFLQENSGVNNFHVSNAVEKAKAELENLHAEEIEKIKAEYEAELQVVRNEEAGNAMEKLTSVLLGLDTSTVIPTAAPSVKGTPSKETESTAEVEEVVEEEADELISSDPYIDTAMCTSCNECTGINGDLFKYNGDKMAYIADPKAGTFKELVEGAELCPVKIIHPGAPLNPDEPDLDDLIQRAAKFN